jgi:hypothetical protein
VVAVFWHTLTATAFWGLALYQTKDHGATRVAPQPELVLHTASSTASTTPYRSIRIPHLFSNTDVLPGSDGLQTVFSNLDSSAYYLISPMGAYKDGYLAGQTDKSASEIETLCSMQSNIFSINPCTDNRSFLQVIMNTSNTTARLFSGAERKSATATFLLLKSTYLPPATEQITPFGTDTISGHLAYDPNDAIAYFFDTDEAGYEMVFVHMDQTEIESILASITNDE